MAIVRTQLVDMIATGFELSAAFKKSFAYRVYVQVLSKPTRPLMSITLWYFVALWAVL